MIRRFTAWFVAAVLMHYPATISAAGHPDASTPDGIGRLFLDPAERGKRPGGAAPSPPRASSAAASDTQTGATPATFHLNGIAIDERGHMTLWVNGARFEPDSSMRMIALDAPGRVRITMADRRRTVELRVGQRLDLDSQRVMETFEGRPPVIASQLPLEAVPIVQPTPTSLRRAPTRAPAIHLHVHTAKPGSRRKASRREDD